MLVKFIMATGDSISLVARDKRGRETESMKDAIRAFQSLMGDVPFILATDAAAHRERALTAPLSPAREAEIRASFPNLFN